MKENVTYTTPEGDSHKVLMVDEINKMVYINLVGSAHRWVHEPEYSTWKEVSTIYVPDMPAQMTDEQAQSVGEDIQSQSKNETDAISEQNSDAVDVCEQTTDGEGVVSGNSESISTSEEESENKIEEKPKRKRTVKKQD